MQTGATTKWVALKSPFSSLNHIVQRSLVIASGINSYRALEQSLQSPSLRLVSMEAFSLKSDP